MLNRKFFIFLFFMLLLRFDVNTQERYWEDLSNDEMISLLLDSNTCKLAINYFAGNFKASDDSTTFQMLDRITEKNNVNPFHFYVFNEILLNSDGALAEVMSSYCLKVLLNFPQGLINYFSNQYPHSNLAYSYYVSMLAKELYFNRKYMRYENEEDRAEEDFTYESVKNKLDYSFSSVAIYGMLMNDIKQKMADIKRNQH